MGHHLVRGTSDPLRQAGAFFDLSLMPASSMNPYTSAARRGKFGDNGDETPKVSWREAMDHLVDEIDDLSAYEKLW